MPTQTLSIVVGLGLWALAWWLMLGPASGWDFTHLAMILMLASTLAAVLLPARLAASLACVSVLAFDWFADGTQGQFGVASARASLVLARVGCNEFTGAGARGLLASAAG